MKYQAMDTRYITVLKSSQSMRRPRLRLAVLRMREVCTNEFSAQRKPVSPVPFLVSEGYLQVVQAVVLMSVISCGTHKI